MINEKAFADLGAGVNVYSRLGMRNFANDPGEHWRAKQIKLMSKAMPNDSGDAGITENDFVETSCCGIAIEGRAYVGIEQSPHLWQGMRKGLGD